MQLKIYKKINHYLKNRALLIETYNGNGLKKSQ